MTLIFTSEGHETMLIILAMLENIQLDTKIIQISQSIAEILLFEDCWVNR